jgi:hypothetical protein
VSRSLVIKTTVFKRAMPFAVMSSIGCLLPLPLRAELGLTAWTYLGLSLATIVGTTTVAALVSPEFWIDRNSAYAYWGFSVGTVSLPFYRKKIVVSPDAFVVMESHLHANRRRRGWRLGVRTPSGGVVWFGFAKRRHHIYKKLKHARKALFGHGKDVDEMASPRS